MLDEIVRHNYKNMLKCSIVTEKHGHKREGIAKSIMFLLNNFCKINDVNIYFNIICLHTLDIFDLTKQQIMTLINEL